MNEDAVPGAPVEKSCLRLAAGCKLFLAADVLRAAPEPVDKPGFLW
jgi:hypothetical protein